LRLRPLVRSWTSLATIIGHFVGMDWGGYFEPDVVEGIAAEMPEPFDSSDSTNLNEDT
jgi:hypothetical protein